MAWLAAILIYILFELAWFGLMAFLYDAPFEIIKLLLIASALLAVWRGALWLYHR